MPAKIADLGVAVVAWRNTIISPCIPDLIKLHSSVVTPGFSKTGLQITSPAATTVIVGSVRMHVNEIFFTHNRFDDKPKIFCDRITEGLPHKLAGVMNRKRHLEILVPVSIDS